MSKALAVLSGHHNEAGVGNPKPNEVLYTPPNADGSRKKCANCTLYESPPRTCMIHAADVLVEADDVCGYHVYGRPLDGATSGHREFMQAVDPELSGLAKVPGGTSCDTCAHYTPSGTLAGTCGAVSDPEEDAPALVQPLGCCARWTEPA